MVFMFEKLVSKWHHYFTFPVNFDESQKKWFLDYYRKLCTCGNPNKDNRVGSVTLALQVRLILVCFFA